MRIALFIFVISAVMVLAVPALAASDDPIASKDGTTYTLEDMSLYFLLDLGISGLNDFFQMMAAYQEGLKQGLKPTPAEISEFIDKQLGQETFQKYKQLYSDKAINKWIEYTIVVSKYSKWLRDKIRNEKHITATEEEAKKFYWDNIKDIQKTEGVDISIISVTTQAEADAALKRLAAGENFNDVAGEVNRTPEMRSSRGWFGLHRRGATVGYELPGEVSAMLTPEQLSQLVKPELPKTMEDAAFALKDGQYSSIIKLDFYNIIYCHKHYPEVSPTFDELKQDLMEELIDRKIDPLYSQALEDLLRREMPRFNIMAELFKAKETAPAPAITPKPANPKPATGENKGGSIGPPPRGGK